MVQSTVSPAETVRNHPDTEIVAKHTPTPWRVFKNKDGTKLVGIGARDGMGILDAGFGVWSWNDPEGIANAEMVVKAVNSHDALAKRIARLEADLNECREYLENLVDVNDGDYGAPSPNRAMQLVSMIDETLNGPGA